MILELGAWQTLGTLLTDAQGNVRAMDMDAGLNSHRFYRIRKSQTP